MRRSSVGSTTRKAAEQNTVTGFAEDHAARRRVAIDRDDRVTDLAGGASAIGEANRDPTRGRHADVTERGARNRGESRSGVGERKQLLRSSSGPRVLEDDWNPRFTHDTSNLSLALEPVAV